VIASLREIAHALGGDVAGGQVLAPGPGHGPRDRSLSIKLSTTSPDSFIAHSFAGDDWQQCRDHVCAALGIVKEGRGGCSRENPTPRHPTPKRAVSDDASRIKSALEIWRESGHPGETPIEPYLESRGLALDGDFMLSVVRWNERIAAMVTLFRNIETNAPQAISRTYLDAEGRKLERKFLGPVGGAAIKLDPDDEVTMGLHVGEGLETCISARQLGLRPTWALGSAGAVAAFPVLGGIECITLLAEHDEASARAVEACADRWLAAGREVIVNEPIGGKDLNDSIRRGRHDG
jgi:putative DNA primase/helicase